MSHRIVEFAEGPALLHVRNNQLAVDREGLDTFTTPLSEIAVLVLTHPRVQLTQSVIAGLSACGGTVVVCDHKYLPAAMLLPLQANFVQTERYAKQAQVTEPLRKRLWQQLVQAKIRAQARALEAVAGSDGGLKPMAERVRSGDVDNLEAQAARRYWPLLFNDPHFRRGNEGPNQNNHLNYGYAILRGVMARATCAAGLHPSFGLNHHNRYNPFCLADDLMEPFRPIVDLAVAQWVEKNDPSEPLDGETKRWILERLVCRFEVDGEERTLFDCAGQLAASVMRAIMSGAKELEVPEPGNHL